MISPTDLFPQQNQAMSLPGLLPQQSSETRAQKPLRKKRRRYNHSTARDRARTTQYRHTSTQSRYIDSKSSAIATRKVARSRGRSKRDVKNNTSSKSKGSKHSQRQISFRKGILRFIMQILIIFCGLGRTTRQQK